MIKVFRNIRQRLLVENRVTRYLLYALGEIFLVVIGILIALQVNEWNEQRKRLIEEKATIASLKLEFEKNISDLNSSIMAMEAFINAGKILLVHSGPDYEYGSLKKVDSLIAMTSRMDVWDPSLYTLSAIKNSGKLSSLSNENLKIELIEWDSFYSNLLDWGDFYVTRGQKYFDYLEANSINRNLNNSSRFQFGSSRFKGTNEELLRQQDFESVLTNRVIHHSFMLGFYEDAKRRMEKIIEECKTYED